MIHTKYVHNCVIFALFSFNYLYCFKFIDRILNAVCMCKLATVY